MGASLHGLMRSCRDQSSNQHCLAAGGGSLPPAMLDLSVACAMTAFYGCKMGSNVTLSRTVYRKGFQLDL